MVGAGDYEVGNRGREGGRSETGKGCRGKRRKTHLPWRDGGAKEITLKGWRKAMERWGKQRQEEAVEEPADLISYYPSTRGIAEGQSDRMTLAGHSPSRNRSPCSPKPWVPLQIQRERRLG